jgi:hypothetical protein
MRTYRVVLAFGLLTCLVCGCTHTQLRWNTVQQSRTLTDIYEQQVLNNLAMFVYDPNSLPFFSFPNAGGSNVNDAGSFSGMFRWSRGTPGLGEGDFGLGGSRTIMESWTMTPIIDPVKLQLMRCAYQQVVAACGIGNVSFDCPDCEQMRNAYMGRVVDPKRINCQEKYALIDPQAACPCQGAEMVEAPPAEPVPPEENKGGAAPSEKALTGGDGGASASSHNTPSFPGTVTTDCLQPCCWLGYGCKKCMHKCKGCVKVGQYCGLHVWVRPGGQDELTKLTLIILNYAYNDPTPVRTKSVEWVLDGSGCGGCPGGGTACCPACQRPAPPSAPAAAAFHSSNVAAADAAPAPQKITVTATIPFDEPVVPYCGNNTGCGLAPATHNVFERPHLLYGNSQPSAIPGAGYLQFQQNATNLAPTNGR